MKTLKNMSLLFFFIIFYTNPKAQCSDAGACSIESIHQTDNPNHNNAMPHSIGVSYSYSFSGKPDNNKYHLIRLAGNFSIGETISFSAVIPFLNQLSGINDKSTAGPGDIILSFGKIVSTNDDFILSIIGGGKIPISLINKDNFGYLNGYGTLDLIAGFDCKFSNFNTSLITQIPFTKYTDDNIEFNRGTDLVFQFGFSYYIKEWSFAAEGVMIKRLAESEITVKNNPVETVTKLADSDFLQLNLALTANYRFSGNILFDLSTAFPLLKREENTDGTKRAFTLQVGTKFILN